MAINLPLTGLLVVLALAAGLLLGRGTAVASSPAGSTLWGHTQIRHHAGVVPMAASAARHAMSPDVVRLARAVEQGQAAEIELMQDLLAARGPASEAGGHDGDEPAPAASSHSGYG